jgi:hypothetical protein
MKMDYCDLVNFMVTLAVGLSLLLGPPIYAHTQDMPQPVKKAIEKKFPGAIIKEISREEFQGQPVTEVELTSQQGDYCLEVLVSDSGEILSIKEEDDCDTH